MPEFKHGDRVERVPHQCASQRPDTSKSLSRHGTVEDSRWAGEEYICVRWDDYDYGGSQDCHGNYLEVIGSVANTWVDAIGIPHKL